MMSLVESLMTLYENEQFELENKSMETTKSYIVVVLSDHIKVFPFLCLLEILLTCIITTKDSFRNFAKIVSLKDGYKRRLIFFPNKKVLQS